MSQKLLENKHILLGITGSIAIYKSIELLRLLTKAGAKVRVMMSEDAKRFITPLTFEALSGNPVISASTESWANDANHIHIHRWSDLFCIAPTTANTINKLAHGIADNLVTQTALASPKSILIAPAANTQMINHTATKKSLETLKNRGVTIVDSIEKKLACQDFGKGAMAEPEYIFWQIAREFLKEPNILNHPVVVTGGGTREAIDSVRFISNYSSGKMAEALATALFLKGANVTLLSSTKNHTNILPFECIPYESSLDLRKQLKKLKAKNETLFMAAAVSDYVPEVKLEGKFKKNTLGLKWKLELAQNTDILKEMSSLGFKCIGFKAETDPKTAHENAEKMFKNKNLHAVCLNILNDTCNFGSEQTRIDLFLAEGWKSLPLQSKLDSAFKIVDLCLPCRN
ncbi:MAG: bifunctional phosphopantothenoylcysteine decarboxylase/phosphopantothenate--cysteine ligase CoaBC [Campylobacteraceae bacterium]|nr:bifunctional phosphopantothenoylcysteine decarboxylase/phosphopantothenate--cysteine ligase CoaBC [Campylobacteraceae bacterium]